MRESLRQFLQRYFPTLWAVRAILVAKESYLRTTGWLYTFRQRAPKRADGSPLPLMNYTIISIFESRLTNDLTVFEYGSGMSTLFFADRTRTVESVEYDAEWYEVVTSLAPSNVTVQFIPQDVDGSYCRSIGVNGRDYDMVVIDGRDRVNCFKHSLSRLTDRGVIILDDSDRERYASVFPQARSNGFKNLDIVGLKPSGFEAYQTTIFYRPGNCLDI